jgi:pimeloyl-ACP methyl ester carboxylesterase
MIKAMTTTNRLYLRRSGTGPAVVLIHGVAGSGAIWDQLVPLLEPQFDLIRVDLLGYGFSPRPHDATYDASCHITAIHDTIAALGLTQPYAVMGLSMGALLALDYAAVYPAEVTALVCLGLPYYRSTAEATVALRRNLWTGLVLQHPQLARVLIPPAWGLARRSAWVRRTFGPSIYSDQITKESAMAAEPAFAATVRQVMRDYRIDAVLPATATIPKLFIHGDHDQWAPASRVHELVASLPQASFKEITASEHNVAVLHPELTARLSTPFLRSSS